MAWRQPRFGKSFPKSSPWTKRVAGDLAQGDSPVTHGTLYQSTPDVVITRASAQSAWRGSLVTVLTLYTSAYNPAIEIPKPQAKVFGTPEVFAQAWRGPVLPGYDPSLEPRRLQSIAFAPLEVFAKAQGSVPLLLAQYQNYSFSSDRRSTQAQVWSAPESFAQAWKTPLYPPYVAANERPTLAQDKTQRALETFLQPQGQVLGTILTSYAVYNPTIDRRRGASINFVGSDAFIAPQIGRPLILNGKAGVLAFPDVARGNLAPMVFSISAEIHRDQLRTVFVPRETAPIDDLVREALADWLMEPATEPGVTENTQIEQITVLDIPDFSSQIARAEMAAIQTEQTAAQIAQDDEDAMAVLIEFFYLS